MVALVTIVFFFCIDDEIINCHLSFVNLLFYLCAMNERGCPARAEIIPYEPDPDSAGGGIGFLFIGIPFSFGLLIKSI